MKNASIRQTSMYHVAAMKALFLVVSAEINYHVEQKMHSILFLKIRCTATV